MPAIGQVGTGNGVNETSNLIGQNALDKQTFLNLLVTQLKYQDPLNPMENTEFVAQLSQFSSLEQLWNVNENMQAETLLSQSIHNSMVASLVGKEVKAVSNAVNLSEDGQSNISFSLADAANTEISIYDESGNLVRTIDQGLLQSGNHEAMWDGKDNQGNQLPAGDYAFYIKAVDVNGNDVTVNSFARGQITGVRFIDGSPILLVGNQEIKPADVVEIVLPDSG